MSESGMTHESSRAQPVAASDRPARTMADLASASASHGRADSQPVSPSASKQYTADSSGRAAKKPSEEGTTVHASETNEQVGRALPGDRGPRDQAAETPRPSFWRRIALGRNRAATSSSTNRTAGAAATAETTHDDSATSNASPSSANTNAGANALATRRGQVATARDRNLAASESIETRIVEPLLQALVSVEAKLERSHVDLVGRSDQVEQRLTQLWDIEEQLGALGELQESLLQVSEQQRRLEGAIVSQTTTIRWLVGAVFVSLAAAAFVVAALLR